jgi:hypothetical protein
MLFALAPPPPHTHTRMRTHTHTHTHMRTHTHARTQHAREVECLVDDQLPLRRQEQRRVLARGALVHDLAQQHLVRRVLLQVQLQVQRRLSDRRAAARLAREVAVAAPHAARQHEQQRGCEHGGVAEPGVCCCGGLGGARPVCAAPVAVRPRTEPGEHASPPTAPAVGAPRRRVHRCCVRKRAGSVPGGRHPGHMRSGHLHSLPPHPSFLHVSRRRRVQVTPPEHHSAASPSTMNSSNIVVVPLTI